MSNLSKNRVRKAVIPAAGLGTRYLPATKAVPKEMIPIIDVPMIQYIVEEAVQSGIEDVVLVTARGKEAIENHFDYQPELDVLLQERQKEELLRISRSVSEMCNLIFIRQKEPLGLGHAVLTAKPIIGDEPFAVLLGDDLIDTNEPGNVFPPCTRQLCDLFEEKGKSVVGVMEVPEKEVSKYGIVGGKEVSERLMEVSELKEKPDPDRAPSRLAIPGRYVLQPQIFECIEDTPKGRGGEIQLTDGLQKLAERSGLLAYQFFGNRYDAGDRLGMIEATLVFALRRPDLAEGVKKLLKKYGEN